MTDKHLTDKLRAMPSRNHIVGLSFALVMVGCAQNTAASPPSAPQAPPDGPPPTRTSDDHSPSTEQERRAFVRWTRSLEDDPLQPQAQDARARLLLWTVNVPDIGVTVCGSLLGPVLARKGPFDAILVGQLTFAGAAFAIEHPERAKDVQGQRLAELDGALRVYEHLLPARPEVRSPYLDDLLARRARGPLAALAETCPKE